MACKGTLLLSRNSFKFSDIQFVTPRLIMFYLLKLFLCKYILTCKLRREKTLFNYYQQSVYDMKIAVQSSPSEIIHTASLSFD